MKIPLFTRSIPLILFTVFCSVGAASIAESLSGIVQSVTDGDSLKISFGGRAVRVRLVCVDAPESRENPKALRDSSRLKQSIEQTLDAGQRSTQYLKGLVPKGSPVTVIKAKESTDQYGRLLGYLYLPDGTFVNKRLVSDGYAGVACYSPNDSYAEEFLALRERARSEKRGLWAIENTNLARTWKR